MSDLPARDFSPSWPAPQGRPVVGGEEGQGRRAVAGAAARSEEMTLGQLLCSRLCHDLIGPATAISAGQELLRDGDASDGEAGDLLADSTRQLAGRLTFFRVAFGQSAQAAAAVRTAEIRALVEGYLAGGRVSVEWAGDVPEDQPMPGETTRILLCLVMLAADALPRGGRIRLDTGRGGGLRLALLATGRSARLGEEMLQALQASGTGSVTARTVHAYYLASLMRSLRGSLIIDGSTDGELRIVASLPGDGQRAGR
jgi:histidine phosphotransferase ChpT